MADRNSPLRLQVLVAPHEDSISTLNPTEKSPDTFLTTKDKTHLRDMLEIGLIDATWPSRYPPQLAARLQQLIDTPEG